MVSYQIQIKVVVVMVLTQSGKINKDNCEDIVREVVTSIRYSDSNTQNTKTDKFIRQPQVHINIALVRITRSISKSLRTRLV